MDDWAVDLGCLQRKETIKIPVGSGPGHYTVAVKVIDIFGNDTITLVPINPG